MEFDQAWLDSINKRLRPLIRRLADATLPICQPGRRGLVSPAGSGVLLRIGVRHYLLTASHVFGNADRDQPIAAIVADKFVRIRSRWRSRAIIEENADSLDLAVAPLEMPDEFAENAVSPIELADIDPFGALIEQHPHTSFLALGYPRSKQPKILREGKYAAFAYHFLTHLEDIAPSKSLAGSPELHIAVGYQRDDFHGDPAVSMMPDPDGMSGGGLWRIPDAIVSPAPSGQLVGILIEHHSREEQVIAARILPLLQILCRLDPANDIAIRERFPGVNSPAT